MFLLSSKDFWETKEENITLNIDALNFEINMLNLTIVALFFVFNKLLIYSRLKKSLSKNFLSAYILVLSIQIFVNSFD